MFNLFNEEIMELTVKLNGIILRKAELENNFTSVYSKVFEKINEIEGIGEEEFLLVLGDVGG